MVKTILAGQGEYLITVSANTEEEWNLIQQAKKMEQQQNLAAQKQTVDGVDWDFFFSGKRTQSIQNTADASDGTGVQSLADEEDALNLDEWTVISG